jgi:hypothetical protein
VEHEVPYEEGADMDQLAKSVAIFSPDLLIEQGANRAPNYQKSFIALD